MENNGAVPSKGAVPGESAVLSNGAVPGESAVLSQGAVPGEIAVPSIAVPSESLDPSNAVPSGDVAAEVASESGEPGASRSRTTKHVTKGVLYSGVSAEIGSATLHIYFGSKGPSVYLQVQEGRGCLEEALRSPTSNVQGI